MSTPIARTVLRRVLASCLAALVLVATLTAGRPYLWCSMMERRVEACCCKGEEDGTLASPDQGPEIQNGCCEGRDHDELSKARVVTDGMDIPPVTPSSSRAPGPMLVRNRFAQASLGPAPDVARGRTAPIRAGPRCATESCVRLQVFRC
jgi:hypothetical protein